MPDRAIVFVDGNNWFHYLQSADIGDRLQLDYRKISRKLLGPRDWLGTRYYIGQVNQQASRKLYADQRTFLASLRATDPKITIYLGRLEARRLKNEAARELKQYVSSLRTPIDKKVRSDLLALARKYERSDVFVEKAVDVMLAVDMVQMAAHDEYDAAYLLSADGDFTPAVTAVRGYGKKIYGVCPSSGYGAQLAQTVDSFIRPTPSWFSDCYKD